MTKRTRLFMSLAAGFLVVGTGVGLVAVYSGLPVLAQFGSGQPSELEYLPQDASLIAFVNARDVMDSELRQKLMTLSPELGSRSDDLDPDPDSRENAGNLFGQAGIDLETDVDAVVLGLFGSSDADNERPLMLARGRFDDDLIETLIRQRGGEVEDYQGIRLLTRPDDDNDLGVAFVEPDLVAIGTVEMVRQAIDARAGWVASVTGNAEVMALVGDVDDGNAWAVGRFDAVSRRSPLPQDLTNQLPVIDWFAASGYINGGVEGVVRVDARDEMAAQDLREVLEGFLALARLQAGGLEQFRTIVDSIVLGGQGQTVSLRFLVPSSVIDALADLQAERNSAAPLAAP